MGTQMVVFQLGDERYAVPISNIREIIVPPVIRPIPDSKEHVLDEPDFFSAYHVQVP